MCWDLSFVDLKFFQILEKSVFDVFKVDFGENFKANSDKTVRRAIGNYYRVFHVFRQAKSAYSGSILSSSRFCPSCHKK
jgi:hypothetical protein